MESEGRADEAHRPSHAEADRVTPALVQVLVDGHAHRVSIPVEWTGTLQISLSVHRGRVSRKILVGRATTVYLAEDGGQRDIECPSSRREAVGGAGGDTEDGEAG